MVTDPSHTRHCRVSIDLDAIRSNYRYLKSTAPASRLIAVVKADAYGHGAVEVARALIDADAFAVATTEEAIQLRDAGITQTIIVLGGVIDAGEMADCFEFDLAPVFHQFQQIDWLMQSDPSASIDIWLKLNSGMGRLGFNAHDFKRALQRVELLDAVTHVRLMTHLANADDRSDPKSTQQIDMVESLGLAQYEWSVANSAGILAWPSSRLQWLRSGIALYGSDPMLDQADAQQLKPVMRFSARVLAVNTLQKGDTVGYGGLYTCLHEQTIAVVAAGYADGYPRHLQGGYAIVEGQRAKVVGRVSMDMITLDVTGLDVKAGAEVVLWGDDPLAEMVASASETISYELFCHAGCHGKREYINR